MRPQLQVVKTLLQLPFSTKSAVGARATTTIIKDAARTRATRGTSMVIRVTSLRTVSRSRRAQCHQPATRPRFFRFSPRTALATSSFPVRRASAAALEAKLSTSLLILARVRPKRNSQTNCQSFSARWIATVKLSTRKQMLPTLRTTTPELSQIIAASSFPKDLSR